MRFLLVLLAWHAFFLLPKVLVRGMAAMDGRYIRGIVPTILGLVLLLALIDPFSKWIAYLGEHLFDLSRWGLGSNLEAGLIAIVLMNFGSFVLFHNLSKRSKIHLFKWLYSFHDISDSNK